MHARRLALLPLAALPLAALTMSVAPPAGAIDPAFTYQGQLQAAGSPVDGPCDLQFSLFDSAGDGLQIGPMLTFLSTPISNGLFTLFLNFGSAAFDGGDRWLRIDTRCPAGTGGYTTLAPRQPITATPYALFAASIADAAVTTAKLGDAAVGTAQIADAAVNGAKVADASIGSADVSFNYAGSTSKGGPAGDVVCVGCVATVDLQDGGVPVEKISAAGSVAGQVVTSMGATVAWEALAVLELPYTAITASNTAAFEITNTGTGAVAHFVGTENATGPALLAEYGGFAGAAIEGRANSDSSAGVLGTSTGTLAAAVQGSASGLNGIGVRGSANGPSARAVAGVSIDGFAGHFDGRVQANGLLTVTGAMGADLAIFESPAATNRARIDSTGKGFFNGGVQMSGADVAEFISASDAPGPGDVVEIDAARPGQFRRAATPNSTAVAGVISTRPGVSLNAEDGASAPVEGPQLALVGRVPVKASAENGPIHPGDLLVAAATPGHAMRGPANPAPGTVIGKALHPLDAGTGVTEMLVMLR